MASRREGERVGDFQIEWFQPVYAPVQVRLAHTSSGLSTAAISFDAYPQGKCALCGKKGMVHNPAEVQAARFARLANLKAAYRLGPPTCLQRAAMRGCTARPVRRQLHRDGPSGRFQLR